MAFAETSTETHGMTFSAGKVEILEMGNTLVTHGESGACGPAPSYPETCPDPTNLTAPNPGNRESLLSDTATLSTQPSLKSAELRSTPSTTSTLAGWTCASAPGINATVKCLQHTRGSAKEQV